jgi:hypothetical protein
MKKISLVLFITILMGCFSSKQASTTVSQQTFTFDYAPKESFKPGSAGMVLAFLKPNYTTQFTYGGTELFKRFQEALGSDIEELIIAKGFTMKGPFSDFDEMIFDDKKSTDVAIKIEILPQFTAVEGGWQTHVSILGPSYNTYSYNGKCSLIGKINLAGVEPLTNEKIWSKSVNIPNVENIEVRTSNKYNSMLNAYQIMQDPGVYNAIGKALQAQYSGILDKIAAHFSPEEFNSLKPQIKELKSKKGF